MAEEGEGHSRAEAYLSAILVLSAPRDTGLVQDAFTAVLAADSDALRWTRALRPAFLWDTTAWDGVLAALAEHLEVEGDVPTVRRGAFEVAFYSLGDYERGAELGGGAEDPSAWIELARAGNWRKVHEALRTHYAEHGKKEAEWMATRHEANIALGLGKVEKAVTSLRKISRSTDLDGPTRDLLKGLYRKEGKWTLLIDMLKKQVKAPDSDTELLRNLRAMVHVYRTYLQNDVMEVQTHNAILKVAPDDQASLLALTDKLAAMKRYPDLVDVLRRRAGFSRTISEQTELLLEVANIYVEKFHNQAEAVRSFEAVLAVDNENTQAVEFLGQVYKQRKDWKKFVAIRRQELGRMEPSDEKREGLREIAGVAFERLRDPQLAESLWHGVLELSPEDDGALAALSKVYDRQKDWPALAGVLERRLPHLEGQELVPILERLGELHQDKLGNREKSVEFHEALVALAPDNRRATESLKKGYIELRRWDDLERFFGDRDAWPEFVRMVEHLASGDKNPSEAIELYFRSARVWSEVLDDPRRTMRALERVMTLDPRNRRAAAQLAEFYESDSNFRKLRDVLVVLLTSEEEADGRYGLQLRLARLCATLRDQTGAFEYYSDAVRTGPKHLEIHDEVEKVTREISTWDSLEATYRNALDQLLYDEDDEAAAAVKALRLRLGHVLHVELNAPDQALTAYNEVLERDSQSLEAVEALIRIHAQQGNNDELLEMFSRKFELVEAVDVRVDILQKVALIHEEGQGDPASAVEDQTRVIELIDESHAAYRPTLHALHRLYAQLADWNSLLEVIGKQLAVTDPEDEARLDLQRELGTVSLHHLADVEGALSAYAIVLESRPTDQVARDDVETLLDSNDHALGACAILEPILEAEEGWGDLVRVLEIRLTHTDPSDETVAARKELLGRLVSIHSTRRGDVAEAFEAATRLLTVDPADESVRSQLEGFAQASDGWGQLAEVYIDRLNDLLGDEERTELATWYANRVAQIAETYLGDVDRAIDYYRQTLELSSEKREALDALADLYVIAEQWPNLLEAHQRQIELSEDPDEIRAIHFKIAALYEGQLDEPSNAVDTFRTVLESHEEDGESLAALDRLFEFQGQYAELAGNLERQIELTEDGTDEWCAHMCRLGGTQEEHLGEVSTAVDTYQAVLERRMDHETALGALERLIEEPEVAGKVSRILGPIYDAFGEQQKLVDALGVELEFTDELDPRLELFHRVAELRERGLGDPVGAFSTLLSAAAEAPLHEATLGALYRLAGEQQAWGELVARFHDLALDQGDPDHAAALYVRLARLSEDRLKDPKRAAGYWGDVLDQRPGDEDAIHALELLYRDLGAWEELVEILLKKVELEKYAEDIETQKADLFQASTIYDEFLQRPDDAITMVERIHAIDPTDGNALDEANRLYRRTERWTDLIEILSRKADLCEDDESRGNVWREMGPVFEVKLEELGQAIDVYRKIVEKFPADDDALDALVRLYRETDNWPSLLEVLAQKEGLAEAPADARDLRYQQGRLLQTELLEIGKAIDVYASVLSEDPDHVQSLAALEELLLEGQDLARVSAVLDPLYRQAHQWEQLIRMYGILVEESSDREARAGYHVRIADVREAEQGNKDAAFDSVCTALSETPSNGALADRAESLAREQGRFPELVNQLAELREDVTDTAPRLALGKRAARIYETELQSVESAIEAYIAVAEIDPGDGDALASLDRLYEQSFQFSELADIIERRVLAEVEPSKTIELRFRLGTVLRTHLANPILAVETYREILAIEAGHGPTINALREMFDSSVEAMDVAPILEVYYRDREDWAQLIELKLAILKHQDDSHDRFTTLVEAGGIATDQVQEPEQALIIFGRALAERPSNEAILEKLDGLAAETGDFETFAQILKVSLDRDPDDLDARRLSLKLAQTLYEKVKDVEDATQWFKFTLELDETNAEALTALDAIYLSQERWPELADILQRERNQAMNDQNMVDLSFRLGQLFEHQLADIPRATAAYRDVADVRPDHRESLAALESIFKREMDWEELFGVYEQLSHVAQDDEERAVVFEQMAALAMNMLDRPEDAIDLWTRVLDNRKDDLNALSSLEVLYETTERHADLVEVLERRVGLATDDADKRELVTKIGSVQRYLGDDQRAIAAYQLLLELDPGNADALLALRELYEERADSESLAGILRQIVSGRILDGEGLLDAHCRLGELYGDVLGAPDQAIESWRAVLDLRPSDEHALDQLERHYLDQSKWEEAAGVLEQKVLLADGVADQIDLLYRISELWQTQVDNPTKAADGYERLLILEPSSDQAFLSLEEIYRGQSNWDRLIEIYLGRLAHLPDQIDRLEVLGKAATVYEGQKADPASAFLVVARMFKEDPLDPEVAARLESLAEAAEMWDTLVELYSDTIGEVVAQRGVHDTMELHQRVSRYYREKTGRPEMAEVHYHKVLDIDAADELALKGLEDIYQDNQSWVELVAILKRRLDLPIDVPEQINLLLKIGLIQWSQIGDASEAIDAFNLALNLDSSNLDALSALEEIYSAREEWRELVEVLKQRADVTYEVDEAVAIRFRIGALWENDLAIPERAIDVYHDILSSKPDHTESLERLESLYLDLQKWERYLDVLEMRLGLDPPDAERVATLSEMAKVYDREFDEIERAIEAYREILTLEPGREDVIRLLMDSFKRGDYWDDLARMLSEQIEKVPDEETRLELLTVEGRVAADQLGDMFRAISCFQRILAESENHAGALNALADLYEQVGQWDDCIATYDKLILASPEVAVQTVLLCRVGRIFEEHVLDDEQAAGRYQTALDLDPGCEEAMRGLRLLYIKQEQWDQAVNMLTREVDYSRDLTEKSALLGEIGTIYEDQVKDEPKAMSFYQQAMDLDPYNVVAAAPLADRYLNNGEWARALPLLQALVEKNPYGDDAEALQNLRYSLGWAFEELDQEEEALQEFSASFDLNRGHLPTLEALSRIYARRRDAERAYELLDLIITQHGSELPADVLAQYLVQQADIRWDEGDKRTAQELFERALGQAPNHAHALRRMIEVLTNKEDWARIVDYQVRLAEVSDDQVERFTLLLDAGDTFRSSLGQTEAAIEAYRAALRVDENSMAVLHRLLEIFTQVEDWKRAAEILVKMAQLETDPEKHARRCRTIGFLLMDNLGDAEKALEFFNRALDTHLALDFLDAFEAIEAILTEQRDWQRLAHQYKKMIKRAAGYVGAEDMQQLTIMLWRNLGEIYRSRLQEFDNAIEAYRAASQLDPKNSATHAILAQLFEMVGGREHDAIAEYHDLIQANPFHFDTYRLLWARYLELQDFDAAWCVSGALVLFNQANEQEKAYYDRYLGPSPPVANKTLTNDQWDVLHHPRLSRGLSRIMQAFATSLRHAISYDLHKTWKVHKKKDLLDLRQELAFAKRYNYTTNVLGVPPANVYVMRDQIGGMRNANADPPALVVGHDMLQGRTERELAFDIGKSLCLVKPELYLGSAYPATNNLKIFFLAAMKVARPESAMAVESPDLDRMVQEIDRNPHLKVALKNVTDAYIQQNENPNFSVWLKALEYTSDRVGLFLCGDVGQAVASIKNASLYSISKATTKERLQEAVLFSMSRPYMKLRKELGLAISG